MAKSKVTNVLVKKKDGQSARQGSNGIYYIIELTFADGTKGDTFAKSETEYLVGQELEFTYTPNSTNPSYNGNIKIEKPRGSFGNSGFQKSYSKGITFSETAAIAAVQMANDLYAKGVIPKEMVEPCAKKRLELIKKLSGESAPLPNPQNPQ